MTWSNLCLKGLVLGSKCRRKKHFRHYFDNPSKRSSGLGKAEDGDDGKVQIYFVSATKMIWLCIGYERKRGPLWIYVFGPCGLKKWSFLLPKPRIITEKVTGTQQQDHNRMEHPDLSRKIFPAENKCTLESTVQLSGAILWLVICDNFMFCTSLTKL